MKKSLKEILLTIGKHCAALPILNMVIADEILGYDEGGNGDDRMHMVMYIGKYKLTFVEKVGKEDCFNIFISNEKDEGMAISFKQFEEMLDKFWEEKF